MSQTKVKNPSGDRKKYKKEKKKSERIYNGPISRYEREVHKEKKARSSKVPHDSRSTRILGEQIFAQGVTKAASQVMQLTSSCMWGVGYAYVCSALQRGWLANAADDGQPFAAWQYITEVLQAFLSGGVPKAQRMPYWLWAIGRAVSAKSVPTRCGNIYFKGVQGALLPSAAVYPLGPISYGYNGNFYVRGSGDTDMFPHAEPPNFSSPEQAFGNLCGFMIRAVPGKMSEMCDSTIKTIFDNDVSAFCTPLLPTGFGSQNVGGINFICSLEVPVHTPLLAPILSQEDYTQTGIATRVPKRTTVYAGDQMTATTMMASGLQISKWRNKIQPNFKFVDFREFHDVIAIWASKLVSQYFGDPANQGARVGGLAQDALDMQCPLTVQELGLILRNEVMTVFGSTQSGVQSLLPTMPQNNNDNRFMPYLTGTTGSGLNTYKVKVPQPIVENLSSLMLHSVPYGNDVQLLYPVIGQYVNDDLVRADYQFEYFDGNGDKLLFPTFAENPPVSRRILNKKTGKEEWATSSIEAVIDFVDTSNGNNYVFINDANRLQTLAALWNSWVTKLESYSSPISVIKNDPGINVLCSVNQTLYWINQTLSQKEEASEVKDSRVESRRELSSTVYSARQAVAISYREAPFGATSNITSRWVLPTILINNGGTSSQDASAYSRMQNLYDETFAQTLAIVGNGGATLASRHSVYADSMVHGRDGRAQLDIDIEVVNSQGHAGILSSLAATFLGNAFGSQVGELASGIASALPI